MWPFSRATLRYHLRRSSSVFCHCYIGSNAIDSPRNGVWCSGILVLFLRDYGFQRTVDFDLYYICPSLVVMRQHSYWYWTVLEFRGPLSGVSVIVNVWLVYTQYYRHSCHCHSTQIVIVSLFAPDLHWSLSWPVLCNHRNEIPIYTI